MARMAITWNRIRV